MSDLISKKAIKTAYKEALINNLVDKDRNIDLSEHAEIPSNAFNEFVDKVPTVPAIPIPDNATNGDVLKSLLYGKAIITEFIHDVNISVNTNVIGQFDMEWWNSPYKRGDTE
jgi:hypothetical protein